MQIIFECNFTMAKVVVIIKNIAVLSILFFLLQQQIFLLWNWNVCFCSKKKVTEAVIFLGVHISQLSFLRCNVYTRNPTNEIRKKNI